MTAVCRLLYLTRLLVTLPLKIKLSENERLIVCPGAALNILLNSDSEQLMVAGKALNCLGFKVLF